MGDRTFHVHARHVPRHHARLIVAASFEAAAVSYLEDVSSVIAAEDDSGGEEIQVIVRCGDSGHEHCFRIDLDTGAARPCG
ncbi:MAG: DUF5961 family protein [Caulobacteraceae bacterium]